MPEEAQRLLITGSRQATVEMKTYVNRALLRAHERGWSIVVGDAEGVDSQVIRSILRVPIDIEYRVYGITRTPRLEKGLHGELPLDHYERVDAADFLTRDRYMVERCDCCLAVWNGFSSGTRYTFQYAKQLGKQVWVIDFRDRK